MKKELTEEQKERKRLYAKEYRRKNKEKIKEYLKDYCKSYYENNKETLNIKNKKYNKEYYQLNKEVIIEKNRDNRKNYYNNNKEILREKRKVYRNSRRKNDFLYKLTSNVRGRISGYIKNNGYIKKSRTHEILGCSYEELKNYLESQFLEWMNWENYGNPVDGLIEPNKSWDIDHIIPLASATNEEELLKLFRYGNLQPLCSYHNRYVKKDNA